MQLYFTLLLLFFSNLLFCQLEQKYDLSSKNLPYWVTLMYDEKSDVGNLIEEKKGMYQIIFETNDKLRNFKLVNL